MRVLLISTNREHSPYPVAPLGALAVAAAAQAAGHETHLLDLSFRRFRTRAIRSEIRTFRPEAVGISIRNLDNCFYCSPRTYTEDVRQCVDAVRRATNAPIILGGSGFSVEPRGWLQRLPVTAGVIGEGESAFPALLERLARGEDPNDPPAVVTPETVTADSTDALTPPSKDDFPAPAHDLCAYHAYLRRGGFVSVQTKRGCPFGCIYCVYPLIEGRTFRLRSPRAVVQEMNEVAREQEVREFCFTDGVFNTPRDHALAVCDELHHRRIPLRWTAFCNPREFDAPLAKSMAKAGCMGVEFGLDATSQRMLRLLDKPFGPADIRRALEAASLAEIPFAIHLLFGGPGDSLEEVEACQDFLDTCPTANGVFASIGMRVYAGAPLERIAREEGSLNSDGLFEPAYYVSRDLGSEPVKSIDAIARRRPEWSTPTDWTGWKMRSVQKVINRINQRPQWLHVRNYGRYMRR